MDILIINSSNNNYEYYKGLKDEEENTLSE